ncbi:MAG: C39 family peptidase [Methanoregula sp.]|jgi:ABC-type bacteriocin/lantibiotic exporter with double-glycine peptidase domain|nr:C39 family peptidase [Methanoregula sp.]
MKVKVKLQVPYYKQKNWVNCGPAVLQMVFGYFQHDLSQRKIAKQAKTSAEHGTENHDMIRVALEHGFHVYVNDNSTFFEIRHFLEKGLPVIVSFIEPTDNEGHFAVVSGITLHKIILNDPWNGRNFKMLHRDFLTRWHNESNTHKEWIMVIAKSDFNLGKQYLPHPKKSAK